MIALNLKVPADVREQLDDDEYLRLRGFNGDWLKLDASGFSAERVFEVLDSGGKICLQTGAPVSSFDEGVPGMFAWTPLTSMSA